MFGPEYTITLLRTSSCRYPTSYCSFSNCGEQQLMQETF
uniref:Uncharacterized protein n=1 Tax=Arundo donax TaxID=35708 RepID=A0A0A8ZCI7_ARUDO